MPTRSEIGPERLEEAERLLKEEGWPYSEVAVYLGINKNTISRWFPGYGLSYRELGVLGNAVRRANAKARKRGEYV